MGQRVSFGGKVVFLTLIISTPMHENQTTSVMKLIINIIITPLRIFHTGV